MTRILVCLTLCLPLAAQPPAPETKQLSDSWTTYSGDYSGRRYSSLKQIDQSNVKHLSLAWSTRITAGLPQAAGARFGFGGPAAAPTIVGGEGTGDLNENGGRSSRIVGA